MTTKTVGVMNSRGLRNLVQDIAEDYDKQSYSTPIDHDAARLIMAAPELLDLVRDLYVALPKAKHNAGLIERAKELLARLDA